MYRASHFVTNLSLYPHFTQAVPSLQGCIISVLNLKRTVQFVMKLMDNVMMVTRVA